MYKFSVLIILFCLYNSLNAQKKMEYRKLNKVEEQVILKKATEAPFTGEYNNKFENGVYVCKQCGLPLYHSDSKFKSGCGWPSFDLEIEGAVTRLPDKDGRRTEITCSRCKGHLGHVFLGEGYTEKNTRHCVNSISIVFIPENRIDTAYFSSGCFWGTQYHFEKLKGVISTSVGYMGGNKEKPSYEDVCRGNTGHLETLRVVFDKNTISYEDLVKLFFETHDFTQENGQGPDIGEQYLSNIFYKGDEQMEVASKYIRILSSKLYDVVTSLKSAQNHTFWEAENYHQHYYSNKGGSPYCHAYKKIF